MRENEFSQAEKETFAVAPQNKLFMEHIKYQINQPSYNYNCKIANLETAL